MMAHTQLQHFTDRETQIAAFDSLWERDSPWVIVFTGVSGNGKSTLIDWFIARRCEPENIHYTKIDLFSGLKPAYVLDRLSDLLPAAATTRYRAGRDAATHNYHQARQQLLQAVAARPIQAIQQANDHSQISQAEIHIQTGQAQAQEELTQIYHDQLTAALRPELRHLNSGRTVVFLDTYERAQESNPEEEMAWLWSLLAEAHVAHPNLRVVVGSRVDVAYQPARAWRTRQPLEAFSREDSDKFLTAWSQWEIPLDLRAAIFNLAQGHPMLTEMAAQLWDDGQKAGRPLTPAELQAGLEHRSAEEWLYGRMITRLEELGDTRLVATARYGPLLREFNLRSLNALLPEGIDRLDDAAFHRFTGYAFVKPTPAGWAFHELMCDVQRAYLSRQDDPEVEACHRRAAAFFWERAKATSDPEAARNALYHTCFLDPAGTFNDWQDEAFHAQLAGDRDWWDELLGVMEAPSQHRRLDQSQKGSLARRRGMWFVRHYQMDAALQSYAQALELFRQVGDRLGEANTRKAIGDVHNFRKELDDALASYAQALELFRQVGSRLGEANTLLAVAPFSENPEEVFGIASSLCEAIGDQYSLARGLYYYAQFLIAQGQTDKAIAALEQCRDKFMAIHLTDLAAAAQQAINELSGQ